MNMSIKAVMRMSGPHAALQKHSDDVTCLSNVYVSNKTPGGQEVT